MRQPNRVRSLVKYNPVARDLLTRSLRRGELAFADCTAFGGIAKRILNEYKPKDEIWLIAKYYSKQQDGKYYKGFIVREIITEKEIQQANKSVFDDLPF